MTRHAIGGGVAGGDVEVERHGRVGGEQQEEDGAVLLHGLLFELDG